MIQLHVLGSPDLRRADGSEVRSVLVQPKRLALLVYLAVAMPRGFHRRDSLVALFWPEMDNEHARAALRNAIYQLRQALGPDCIQTRGANEVRFAEVVCWCDAVAFERAVAEDRPDEAVALYRGELLPGLYVEGAPDVEHWLDRQRSRLRDAACRAGWTLSERALQAGEPDSAARHARWAADQEPGSEAGLRRLLSVLDRAGDTAGALRVFAQFSAWLQADHGGSPSPETRALVAEIRGRGDSAAAAAAAAAPAASAAPAQLPVPVPGLDPQPLVERRDPPVRERRPTRRRGVAVMAGLACAAGLALGMAEREPGDVRPSGAETRPATRSTAAAALFREGLRAHYAGDEKSASRLYRAALREDSTFALAALYTAFMGGPDYLGMFNHAARLADRWSPERERLLVRGAWAVQMDHPSALAVAETLAVRYPGEPDGHLLLGRALIQRGHFSAGAARLRRVLAMDTAGLRTPGARCRACEALPTLLSAYHHMDSVSAAERLVQEWRRMQPHSPLPLYGLTDLREAQGRYREALAALGQAAALEGPAPWAQVRRAEVYLRAGDYGAADELLGTFVREGSPQHRENALWFLVISLRHQGRLGEALAAAERYHREFDNELPAAIVLWEMGRLREAAAAFERISRTGNPAAPPSGHARWRSWSLTHRAGILTALGDTAAVRSLADTIQAVGARSAYARDHRLHHHVRGLLWSARGQHDSAAAAFRRAQYSPVYGYNRVNLELGRALVRAGRPAEAVPVLRHALRTGISATGLYTTAPELRRALGDAWLAAGRPDSAAAHFRWTLTAWRNADPRFAGDIAALQARLAALEGTAPRGARAEAAPPR